MSEEMFLEDEPEKDLLYIKDLKTGDFLENAVKLMYRIEILENHILLTELDASGNDAPNTKKRKFEKAQLDGLIRTKHFAKSKTPRRISHGEVESRLEFNKLTPK